MGGYGNSGLHNFIQSFKNADQIANADSEAARQLSSDLVNNACQTCRESTCEQLRKQLARNKDEQEKAMLANATYDPSAPLPPGYRRAIEADLQAMGLSDGEGENLLRLDDHPDFHAEAFVKSNPVSGAESYVVGFKGTKFSSLNDWEANLRQGIGLETAYYSRAVRIGDAFYTSGVGPASFVGHSLGGGLAAAASGASGLPAQTFNTAGLSAATLSRLPLADTNLVHNTHVTGDILSSLQDNTPAPEAFGLRRSIANVKAANYSRGVWLTNHYNSALENNAKSGMQLHSMAEVQASLKQEEAQIRRKMEENRCGG